MKERTSSNNFRLPISKFDSCPEPEAEPFHEIDNFEEEKVNQNDSCKIPKAQEPQEHVYEKSSHFRKKGEHAGKPESEEVTDKWKKWKLLANVYYGRQKYLYVKRFLFFYDLKHELGLLAKKRHQVYPEGIADKVWILGPDDELTETFSYVDEKLILENEYDEKAEYEYRY